MTTMISISVKPRAPRRRPADGGPCMTPVARGERALVNAIIGPL
jgi:hypothetical protein